MTSRLDDLIRAHAEALDQLADPITLTEVTADSREHTTVVALVGTDDTSARPGSRQFRSVIAVAAALMAVVVGALAYGIADDDSAGEVPPDEPTTGDVLDAVTEEPTLVGSWGQFHSGWVLVFSDGRVILYAEKAPPLGDPLPTFTFVDRYLTPSALERIRTGALTVGALFSNNLTPDNVWAEPVFAVYAPSEYAVCPPPDENSGDQPTSLAQLPAPVQELMRGTLRPYTNVWPIDGQQTAEAHVTPGQCFTLTSEQVRVLIILAENGGDHQPTRLDDLRREGTWVTFETGGDEPVTLTIRPVLPDGQTVLWLG